MEATAAAATATTTTTIQSAVGEGASSNSSSSGGGQKEERSKVLRERQNEERQRKLDELKQQVNKNIDIHLFNYSFVDLFVVNVFRIKFHSRRAISKVVSRPFTSYTIWTCLKDLNLSIF